LNASGFADKIGVQRSSLSHLLSGRNKPSLDFILKILDEFPDVDLYWILNGKGSFPKNEEVVLTKASPTTPTVLEIENEAGDLFTERASQPIDNSSGKKNSTASSQLQMNTESDIDKIVIFYKNGTFKSYVP
jgi:transcriptional regulator with XRE-family HTH domain